MTLAKKFAGFEERASDFRGTRVQALVGGPPDGPPLVLLHGLGGSRSNWALLAPELARTRRVLVVDLPGHGRSSALPAAPGLGPYADRVAKLLEDEGLAPVDVVGHSFGGLVGIRLAVRRPELVRGLVLAAAAGISSSTLWAERVLALVGWIQPARKVSPHWRRVARSAALKRLVLGHWFAADPTALSDDAVEALLADVKLHSDTQSAFQALAGDDPRAYLRLVQCPALVLWGAKDNQLPLDDAFDYARRLRAPLRTIADCGHLLIVERPAACLDALEAFLAAR
ncbi:MAG TPA: alpha/beta fold hydrolase [Gaiellaceae bacterium]|nr:alpha/beta fold hydrolase [Gaiellaceae bacterium]